MKKYEILENCHYQGITYRKGQTVSLPEDPNWPDRFKAIDGEEAALEELQGPSKKAKA